MESSIEGRMPSQVLLWVVRHALSNYNKGNLHRSLHQDLGDYPVRFAPTFDLNYMHMP